MAACHAHADHLLHSGADISDERIHTAWHRMADDWADLVARIPPGERLHTARHKGHEPTTEIVTGATNDHRDSAGVPHHRQRKRGVTVGSSRSALLPTQRTSFERHRGGTEYR